DVVVEMARGRNGEGEERDEEEKDGTHGESVNHEAARNFGPKTILWHSRRMKAHRARMLTVLKQFRLLVRAMDAHYREVESASGLGGAQLWALQEIASEPGLGAGELAQRLAIHPSTASNLVRRLEEMSLVTRHRPSAD